MLCRQKIEILRRKYKTMLEINTGEGVEKREPSHFVGGNAIEYSHYGE